MQTAARKPTKAAAESSASCAVNLSAAWRYDNNLLEERSRIMETLGAPCIDAINHASTEQRSAIDALVATSAELLERVGNQFAAKVESEAGKLVRLSAPASPAAHSKSPAWAKPSATPCSCSASPTKR